MGLGKLKSIERQTNTFLVLVFTCDLLTIRTMKPETLHCELV